MKKELTPEERSFRLSALGDVNEGITLEERARLDAIYAKLIAEGNPTSAEKPQRLYPAETYLKVSEEGCVVDRELICLHHGPITDAAVGQALGAKRMIDVYNFFLNGYEEIALTELTPGVRSNAERFLEINNQLFLDLCSFVYPDIDLNELLQLQTQGNTILDNKPQ